MSSGIMTVNFITVAKNTGTFSWLADNIRNPPSKKTSGGFTNIEVSLIKTDPITAVETRFYISSFKGTPPAVTNRKPANILVYSLDQEEFFPDFRTQYYINFLPTNPIPSSGTIEIGWPLQIIIDEETTCKVSALRSTTDCLFIFDVQKIEIYDAFLDVNEDGWQDNVSITLNGVINPESNKKIDSFTIKTYGNKELTEQIDTLPDGSTLKPKLDCDYPCKTCNGDDRTDCLSCWQDGLGGDPQYLFVTEDGGQCLDICPIGWTTNGNPTKQCETCDESCAVCRDDGKENDKARCISCSEDYPFRI